MPYFLPKNLTPIKVQYSLRELQRINPGHWRTLSQTKKDISSFSFSESGLAPVLFLSQCSHEVSLPHLTKVSITHQPTHSPHYTVQTKRIWYECAAWAKSQKYREETREDPFIKRMSSEILLWWQWNKLERIDSVFICTQAYMRKRKM